MSEALFIPIKKFLYAFVDFDFVGPAKAMEFAHVDELARGSVGLAGVEHHFAFKANCLYHEFAEFADSEFLAGTHVNVAVADFTELGDGAATACAVVTVNGTVYACAVMYAGVFLDADDVAKVHVQEHVYRCIGHVFAPQEFAERLAGAPEGHLVVLDAVLGEDADNFFAGGAAVNAFDRALVHINLDAFPVVIVDEFGQVDLAHHGRHHVAVFKVEVIVRAVKVRGHHGEVVRAVLQVVAFAHLEARNFSNGVFLVRIFKFAREESVFFHGLRGILGVNAGRAQEQELLYVVGIGFAEHVALNFHIHHYKISAVKRVRHDATDKSSRKHYGIGAFFVKELLDGILISKV